MGDERYAGLVEMAVESVRVHMLSSQHVVILKERDRDRYLPIWIGPWEANAIAMKLQGMTPERPLTHDTFVRTIEALGAELSGIVIADLADETFHARLVLRAGEREVELDSRPSDALALAIRTGVRIWADPAVLARAGVVPEAGSEEPLESLGTSEAAPEERLGIFRDFVNSLEVDLEGEHREGPGPEERGEGD
jgi:bifunctional DNase/RNase